MVHCSDMKNGQIYFCEECGLELQVIKECTEDGAHPKGTPCKHCTHICCDKELQLK